MKYSNLSTVVLSCSFVFALSACDGTFGDSESRTLLAKDKTPKASVCDFGSDTITTESTYSVTIKSKHLKEGKKYLVEVQIAQDIESPAGEVITKGTLVIDVAPWEVGLGTISVYEKKLVKGKEEPKLKFQCTFEVEASDTVDNSGYDDSETGWDDTVVTTGDDVDSDSDSGLTTETWRFAVMGDSRGTPLPVNTVVLSKLVKSVIQQDVDLVIFTGDTVFGMALLEYQLPIWLNLMKPIWDAGISVYPVRGNHEATGVNFNALAAWQKSFVGERVLPKNGPLGHLKATYSKVHKNAMFVALDQYVKQHRVHQDWLDEQLALAEVPHIFVFGHEPAFKADHEDCLDDFPQKRDIFWSSLKDAGVRAYFCGHDHFYDHARVDDNDGFPDNDIHQFIVGTTGAELYAWSPPYDGENSDMTIENIKHIMKFGYMVGEITGPNVSLTWINIEGKVEDVWEYTVE